MQVDTAALRKAAARLRAEVETPLGKAGGMLINATTAVSAEAAFDSYTTAAPFTEVRSAWGVEITLLTYAAADLATALEAAADGYDASDANAAGRLAGPR
jgi:Excreted virulence factor EspC, type VII ESX diderm